MSISDHLRLDFQLLLLGDVNLLVFLGQEGQEGGHHQAKEAENQDKGDLKWTSTR